MTVSLGFAVFTFVIYVLAVMRITRLINFDTILDPVRIAAAKVFGPDSTVIYFLGCPWCVSIWVGMASAWIPVVIVGLPWCWFVLVALATSHLVGVAAGLSSDEDIEIETVDAA